MPFVNQDHIKIKQTPIFVNNVSLDIGVPTPECRRRSLAQLEHTKTKKDNQVAKHAQGGINASKGRIENREFHFNSYAKYS